MRFFTVSNQGTLRWVFLGLATWVQASATLVTYGVGPLAAIWQQELSLSQAQVGLLISAVNMGPLVSMMWIGQALDRYGERWIIGAGSLLLGLTMGVVSLINDYTMLLFFLFLVGIHYGTAQPGGSKVVMKWFNLKQRGLAMGIRQAGIPIGGAVAGWFIPLLSTRYDWPVAVLFQAVLAVVGGLVFLFFYKDPNTEEINDKGDNGLWSEWKKLLRKKQLYPLLFAGWTLVFLQLVLLTHLMIYLKTHVTGMTIVSAGQMLTVSLLFGMAGRITLAWLSDKAWNGNRIRPLLLSIGLSVVGLFCYPYPKKHPPGHCFSFALGWVFLGSGGIACLSQKLLKHPVNAPLH